MPKREDLEATLRAAPDLEAYLLAHSGLPGPRANLELAWAAAEVAERPELRRWAAVPPEEAGTNEPAGFVVVCGAIGLGRLIAEGDRGALSTLRPLASDPRWRVREGVAMALQRVGDADVATLLPIVREWAGGTAFERRAAVAAIAEPRLLRDPSTASVAVGLLDRITTSFESEGEERESPGMEALRKALGYGWSVVIVAEPDEGERAFEAWLSSRERRVRWVCRENLRKARLRKLDAAWVEACLARLEEGDPRKR